MTALPTKEHGALVLVPNLLTGPGWTFLKESRRLMGFAVYVTRLATKSDEVGRLAAQIYEPHEPDKYKERIERIEQRGAGKVLRTAYSGLLLEMMLCRSADGFLTYISELLALIFRSRPETLRSSETVRLDEILKHSSMEQLVHDLAERRVNRLSYQGMRDLTAYLADHLGLELFSTNAELEQTVRIVEMRNLIAHNHGVVNEIFISRMRDHSYVAGQRLAISSDQVFDDIDYLLNLAVAIDGRAREKFGLGAEPRPAENMNLDL